jgi:outer membrane protein assembly factor BamB
MPTHRFMARLTALIVIGCSLVALTGCGSSTTTRSRASATATATRTPTATATASPLPDPVQTPTTVVLEPTPSGDPSLCSPASTVAPLPTTLTTLYAGGTDGVVTALNASDGTTRWSHATGVSNFPHLVTSGTIVYASVGLQAANSPTTILALGAADGAVKWQTQITGSPNYGGGFTLTVVNGVVYVPGTDGVVRALDGVTGQELWHAPLGGVATELTVADGKVFAQVYLTGGLFTLRASDGVQLWHFATEANSQMQPVVANGLVYTGETATSLVALNTDTGAVHWRVDIGVEHYPFDLQSAVVAGTGLYVNASGSLYAFNASTGALCWAAPSCFQGAISPPLLDGDRFYETCFFGSPGPGSNTACDVIAVDAHTGDARWKVFQTGGVQGGQSYGCPQITQASLVNSMLYVNGAQASALRADTGAGVWSYPARVSSNGCDSLVIVGAAAYAVFADGTVHALGAADGAPRWSASVGGTYHQLVAGA